ncbi:general transcription factor II-I repeat domain-containing protein 2-like [Centruroides vittatus]|uniref:general transcription factor II-I repeat domain-containing protein 2-like n=1 Tax=Centruroides vittatus TaxID=120091 RepID=UPI0035108434
MNKPSTGRKKIKTYHYHSEWEEDYFFTMMKDKCVCSICNATVDLPKKANVERHFLTVHKNYEEDYPRGTALRKAKMQQLKAQLTAQQSSFFKYNTNSKTATIASFKVADTLIKHNKPFQDGEEAFIKAGEVLLQDFKNKSEIMASIQNMSLSRNTVMHRTEGISQNLEDILHENINKCIVLPLQFDESTDYIGTAQLYVFIRMVFDDMPATEELLTIISMHERTRR